MAMHRVPKPEGTPRGSTELINTGRPPTRSATIFEDIADRVFTLASAHVRTQGSLEAEQPVPQIVPQLLSTPGRSGLHMLVG